MANNNELQDDFFGFNPEIKGLNFIGYKINPNDGRITITATALTEAVDTSLLTTERWAEAAAMHLLAVLCKGEFDVAQKHLKKAYLKHQQMLDEIQAAKLAREKDREISFSKQFGGGGLVNVEFNKKPKTAA